MVTESGLAVVQKRGILWLTLNRPGALNALTLPLLDAMQAALSAARANPDVRVIVITGAGRAFCAGADLEEVIRDSEAIIESIHTTFSAIRSMLKPVIMAVNGTAAAGGLELLLCGDLVVASSSAKIGDAHVNYSLVPGGGSATILPTRISVNRAMALLLTGDLLPAQTLCDWGLVNWVVPDEQLLAFTTSLADRIAGLSPVALQTIKSMVKTRPDAEHLLEESRVARAHIKTEDARRGLERFASGRSRKAP